MKRQKNIDRHGPRPIPNVSPSWPLQLIWFYILTNMFCVLYTEIVRCVEANQCAKRNSNKTSPLSIKNERNKDKIVLLARNLKKSLDELLKDYLQTVHYQWFRNESINVSISKLIIGTKAKHFDLIRLLSEQKQNISICSKII